MFGSYGALELCSSLRRRRPQEGLQRPGEALGMSPWTPEQAPCVASSLASKQLAIQPESSNYAEFLPFELVLLMKRHKFGI